MLAAFIRALDRDIDRVDALFRAKQAELEARLQALSDQLDAATGSATTDGLGAGYDAPWSLDIGDADAALTGCHETLLRLTSFVDLNLEAIRKILKKFDKRQTTLSAATPAPVTGSLPLSPPLSSDSLTSLVAPSSPPLSQTYLSKRLPVRARFADPHALPRLFEQLYAVQARLREYEARPAVSAPLGIAVDPPTIVAPTHAPALPDIVMASAPLVRPADAAVAAISLAVPTPPTSVAPTSAHPYFKYLATDDVAQLRRGLADGCPLAIRERLLRHACRQGAVRCAELLLNDLAATAATATVPLAPVARTMGSPTLVPFPVDAAVPPPSESARHSAHRIADQLTGRMLLHEACATGHVAIARLLLDHGALGRARDLTGRQPLHEAAMYGHTDCAELLLRDGGAAADAIDGDGLTPLFYAVRHGHAPVVKLFLDSLPPKDLPRILAGDAGRRRC